MLLASRVKTAKTKQKGLVMSTAQNVKNPRGYIVGARGKAVKAVWTETKSLLILNGNGSHVVFKRKTPQGYQFVVGSKSSFKPTIEEAKDMVEAIIEFGRWPG